MNHKALAIVPMVAFIAVILFVGAAIAILSPTIANAKIRTKHIRLDAMGEGLPGLVGLPAAEAPPGPTDPPAFGPHCVGCITTQNVANGAITNPKIANNSVNSTQLQSGVIPHVPSITRITVPAGKDGWNPGHGSDTGPRQVFTVSSGVGSGNTGGPDLSVINANSTVYAHPTGGNTAGAACNVFAVFSSPNNANNGFDMVCSNDVADSGAASLRIVVFNP